MNVENMERAVDFFKENYDRIAPNLDMSSYRVSDGDEYNPICSTAGCLCGWLSELDVENVKQNYIKGDGTVNWMRWSEDFFGLSLLELGIWRFLFAAQWSDYKDANTLDQGIARLEYVIKHKEAPDGWYYGGIY